MSDEKTLNPEEKLHKLYATVQDKKKAYADASDEYKSNPTDENREKLDAAAKEYESAVKEHNTHKGSEEYKTHIAEATQSNTGTFHRGPAAKETEKAVESEEEEQEEEVVNIKAPREDGLTDEPKTEGEGEKKEEGENGAGPADDSLNA